MQTKRDLILQMADALEATQGQIDIFVETYARAIAGALAHGEEAILPGLGRLIRKNLPARPGRNPSTGEVIEIPPKVKFVFKPSATLKQRVGTP